MVYLLCLPSHKGGDMLVYLCPVCLRLCVPFCLSVQRFLSCRKSNMRRWPNAGLMVAHRLRRWANSSPVLGYCVMFGATLNVGQRHRRRPNINPALVQSIVPVPPACRYRQHKVLTRAEWILASTGDAGPTFNRHWVSVGLYSPQAVSTTRSAQTRGVEPVLVWCWASVADGGPALGQHWVNVSCLLGVLTSHIVFRTSAWLKIGTIHSA